jgi:hypothetical protein
VTGHRGDGVHGGLLSARRRRPSLAIQCTAVRRDDPCLSGSVFRLIVYARRTAMIVFTGGFHGPVTALSSLAARRSHRASDPARAPARPPKPRAWTPQEVAFPRAGLPRLATGNPAIAPRTPPIRHGSLPIDHAAPALYQVSGGFIVNRPATNSRRLRTPPGAGDTTNRPPIELWRYAGCWTGTCTPS